MSVWTSIKRVFSRKPSSAVRLLPNLSDTEEFLISEIKSMKPQEFISQWQSAASPFSTLTGERVIDRGFRESLWVFVCVSKRMKAIAAIPWVVNDKATGAPSTQAHGIALQKLLDRPNAFKNTNWLKQMIVVHYDLAGNAMIAKTPKSRGSNPPSELWPLNPWRLTPKETSRDWIAWWNAEKDDGDIKRIETKDLIHVESVNPDAESRLGMSTMEPAGPSVDVDRDAAAWQRNMMQNAMVPPGLITYDKVVGKPRREAIKKELKKTSAGPKNARDIIVLGGGPKFTPLGMTVVEADYLETRRQIARELCAAWDVPFGIAGGLAETNYSELRVMERLWYEASLIPDAEDIVEQVSHDLVPDFDPNPLDPSIEIVLDTSKVNALLTRFEQRVDIAAKLQAQGWSKEQADERMDLGMGAFATMTAEAEAETDVDTTEDVVPEQPLDDETPVDPPS